MLCTIRYTFKILSITERWFFSEIEICRCIFIYRSIFYPCQWLCSFTITTMNKWGNKLFTHEMATNNANAHGIMLIFNIMININNKNIQVLKLLECTQIVILSPKPISICKNLTFDVDLFEFRLSFLLYISKKLINLFLLVYCDAAFWAHHHNFSPFISLIHI